MAEHRYPQFCPTARACEILGERWTLLIIRELLCGPQRFTDLRRRLPGVSTSLLTQRMTRLEERGIVARREAPPPAPATLYELTELGAELRPILLQLMRFGVRFIDGPKPGDHLEPEWMRLALEAFAARDATPKRSFVVRIPDGDRMLETHVSGGRRGTQVRDGAGSADATLRLAPMTLLGLLSGGIDPVTAVESGSVELSGDADALRDFPKLFDLVSILARPSNPNPG